MSKYHGYWLMGWLAWGGMVGAGFLGLYRFEMTPGSSGPTPLQWPACCPIQTDDERFTLVMALHPKCPCSRASVGELTAILDRFPERVTAHVLVYEPAETPADWSNDNLERSLGRIPGLNVVHDRDARIAREFGSETSGHVMLYAANGALVFSGGITRGRGQVGTSPGTQWIIETLLGNRLPWTKTDVFGCPLLVPETRPEPVIAP